MKFQKMSIYRQRNTSLPPFLGTGQQTHRADSQIYGLGAKGYALTALGAVEVVQQEPKGKEMQEIPRESEEIEHVSVGRPDTLEVLEVVQMSGAELGAGVGVIQRELRVVVMPGRAFDVP